MNRTHDWFRACLAAATLVAACCAAHGQTGQNGKKLALLIGCTKYDHFPKLELYGPGNDIKLLSTILQSRFQFPPDSIQVLADETRGDSRRPTCENISRAFDRLVEQAEDGSQIVVFLAGHGTQLPISTKQSDPLDAENPEPDGLDEVFLPVDIERWQNGDVAHCIRDNQFGVWLDAMRAKGAHVWVIFDCCHAGTMMRSISDGERSRCAKPEDLGVPPEAARPRETVGIHSVDLTPREMPGSVVEFYGAQAFEEAPELPRPADAPRDPRYYHGLFTYQLVQALAQPAAVSTYGDLGQMIVSKYRGERGSRPPTPFFAGDVQRQVLGASTRQPPPLARIQRSDDGLGLDAGEIHGVTPGSILAILAPGDQSQNVVGYVRATTVTPTTAAIEPVAFEQHQPVELDDLPEGANCRLVVQDVGEMRVRLTLAKASSPACEAVWETAAKALAAVRGDIARLVAVENDHRKAQWLLEPVTPAEAKSRYQHEIEAPGIVLVQQLPAQQQRDAAAEQTPRVYASYVPVLADPVESAKELTFRLERDIQKLFTWQNVWRVCSTVQPGGPSDVTLTLRVRSPLRPGGEATNPTTLWPGERVEILVANGGIDDWWVTVLRLGADYSISKGFSDSLKAQSAFRPIVAKVNAKSIGAEGLVLLATPLTAQRTRPDYSFLEQTALQSGARRSIVAVPQTAFDRLMAGAAAGKQGRGMAVDAPDQPRVVLRGWTVVAQKADEAER